MRIARLATSDGPRLAVSTGGAFRWAPTGVGLFDPHDAVTDVDSWPACDEADLPGSALAPVKPGKIIGIGLNFRATVAEMGFDPPGEPYLFGKLPSSVIGTGGTIEVDPDVTTEADWEGELAVVIGSRVRDVDRANALYAVFGYTAANDVSARDLQRTDGQWLRGKSLDTFCPLGPVMVTADEIADPQRLRIQTWLNDELVQDGNTADMVFTVGELVEFCSRYFTLEPGDVILIGTPPGCGGFADPPRFLADADTIRVDVTDVGVLTNQVSYVVAPRQKSQGDGKGRVVVVIDEIEVFHVAMPLLAPWRTSTGDMPDTHSLLVRMTSEGVTSWAESTPFDEPRYSAEWAGGAFCLLKECLGPLVVGRRIESGADLQTLLSGFKGNYFAKAALDNAWWTLSAKQSGRPLHEILGGNRPEAEVGADFGIEDSVDVLLARVRSAISEGYRRVKLKIGAVDQLASVRAVREAFPDLTVHVDANAGFSLDDMDFFQELDALELAMIEQPLAVDDLAAHARLQEELWTPICLDESITSHETAVRAVEIGACQVINIKPGRVGGLTVAVAISELCREKGIGSWVGGMLESGVGAAICAALATLDGNTYPADIFPSQRFYARDLAEPVLEFTDGPDGGRFVKVPPDAGIAPEPDAEELSVATVAHNRLTA